MMWRQKTVPLMLANPVFHCHCFWFCKVACLLDGNVLGTLLQGRGGCATCPMHAYMRIGQVPGTQGREYPSL